MARAIDDIERDIRALNRSDKERLLEILMTELDAPREELEALARELTRAVARANASLNSALARLDGFDEEIRIGRALVREQVLRAGDEWPFAVPQ